MNVNVFDPLAAMHKACQVFLAQGNSGSIVYVNSVVLPVDGGWTSLKKG